MTKNCSAPITKQQKLLLKVLNCLWLQYVSQRTPNVKIFNANPSEENYNNALNEVKAIVNLINLSEGLKSLTPTDLPALPAFSRIVVLNANGVVAMDTSLENSYQQYITNIQANSPNFASRKTVQNLNVDDCLEQAFQVKPDLSFNPANSENPPFVTQASVVERSGCTGVSNTGFVVFDVEVDIAFFPFEICPNVPLSCVQKNSCDKKNKH